VLEVLAEEPLERLAVAARVDAVEREPRCRGMPEPGALPALAPRRFVGIDHGACPDGRLDLDVGREQGLGGALLQDGDPPQAHAGLGTEERERGLLDLAAREPEPADEDGEHRLESETDGSFHARRKPGRGDVATVGAALRGQRVRGDLGRDRRQVHDLHNLGFAEPRPSERPLALLAALRFDIKPVIDLRRPELRPLRSGMPGLAALLPAGGIGGRLGEPRRVR